MIGCFSRIAAAGNFIIFTGALFVHPPDGWALNWLGKKKGEDIIVKGSCSVSIDLWLPHDNPQ